jgi:hypothetical protein
MRRFHTDASAALAKADKLTHSFADESGLDVQAYMMAKYNMYREAGETNQDLMVRRLHKGLDPALAAIVSSRQVNFCVWSSCEEAISYLLSIDFMLAFRH